MAENFFTDYPERLDQLQKYSDLEKIIIPKEEAFGEVGFYKDTAEAMEFYMGAMSEIGKFCAQELRPSAGDIDREGAKFKDGKVIWPEKFLGHMKKCAELGIFSSGLSRKYEGFNMPWVLSTMTLEMVGQACPNTGLNLANFSMNHWFSRFCTPEQAAEYLPQYATGTMLTSMALTEAGAGSDLGKLRTTAVKQGDHYIVNGTKQFISGGCGDAAFTLARTDPKSSGLNGLSVILCKRVIDGKDNFKVSKIEDKVCLHSSPTCEMVYENSVGTLFGEEGKGFKVMSELMNEARLAMAALALGIAVGAKEEARKYAQTRVTMGKPIIEHPMIADMLYEMEIEIRAMRQIVSEAACAYDWMMIYEKKGDQKNFKKWKKRYRRLTPLCKYLVCEKAIVIARNAVQIFGGYGVCREYPVERLWRETIIYPIYEGTSQIQSLMVLKDTLKDVAQQATGFLGSLAGAWAESKVTRDPVKSQVLQARNELNQGIHTIMKSIIKKKFRSDIDALKKEKIQTFLKQFSLDLLTAKTDLSYPFLVAERFTRITADYYALKSMADHYSPKDKDRKKWILEFAALALPRMRLENHYMVNRLPSTLDWMEKNAKTSAK